MVFTTVTNFIRSRGPDEIWRKRKIFKLAAHFQGRKRNCYSIAIKYVHRALVYATKGRQLKKQDMINLWETRINAGCQQHGINYYTFREALTRCGILLNRKVLADLACWEPQSFKALTDIARERTQQDGLNVIKAENIKSSGVMTRAMKK
ncbi:39s ribosomal protein l20 [Holotrichia oblita]|uniref:39s ribosomal protein l20 n=1 Tax=Holotrichia oblita TaxID=644536 RepID=A0ACB9TCK6_HOLOL|nr:39s ribosomal protein l20 [Holotrichia oblita]